MSLKMLSLLGTFLGFKLSPNVGFVGNFLRHAIMFYVIKNVVPVGNFLGFKLSQNVGFVGNFLEGVNRSPDCQFC